MTDVTDAQPSGREQDGIFDICHFDKLLPFLRSHPFTATERFFIARRVTADVMKIQRRKQAVPAQLMILRAVRAVEKIKKTFVFDDVPIRVDNLVVHDNTSRDKLE